MAYPLDVAFVWHMHQPFYKDGQTGTYSQPWTRLHATKDYLHMAALLNSHPTIHQTFNFVPSLLEQLLDYAAGTALDRALDASQRVACGESLDTETRRFVAESFFAISEGRFIHKYPRYAQLLSLRPAAMTDPDLFSDGFYRDLVAWYNLIWIDPTHIDGDSRLSDLVNKGRGFSCADVADILAKHRDICGQIVPAYRALAARGQVELTTSPYFHPIIPLLVDTRVARVASPWLSLPNTLFAAKRDAERQMNAAVEYHTSTFGSSPRGVWPPEGSVSAAGVEVISRALDGSHGLNWIATDEGILARSLGRAFDRDGYGALADPSVLYKPYLADGLQLAMIFRDQVLSDRIGFVYQNWDAMDAARDLVNRLDQMADRLASDDGRYLVSIILDGENCWEQYANNGQDFLDALYTLLDADPRLRTVTVREHLDDNPPTARLERIHPGSWIGSNFETWIGESAQNRAWEALTLARARLTSRERESGVEASAVEAARREIEIAEGSDWFWWYYSRNNNGKITPFDADFRNHLKNVYTLLNIAPPSLLDRPIVGPPPEHARSISGRVTAPIDAGDPILPGWAGGGFAEPDLSSGSMQKGSSAIRRLYYGYSPEGVRLRLETNDDIRRLAVALYMTTPEECRSVAGSRFATAAPGRHEEHSYCAEVLWLPDEPYPELSVADGDGKWQHKSTVTTAARSGRVVDVNLPYDALTAKAGNTIGVTAMVAVDGVQLDSLPSAGSVSFTIESNNPGV